MAIIYRKSFSSPDEVRTFPRGKVEIVTVAGVTFGRATFEPGWSWSKCVKPIAKTESCQAPHTQYIIHGILHVRTDEGEEFDLKAGDANVLPPGHDAWVVGKHPVVVIDVSGMSNYAKAPRRKAK